MANPFDITPADPMGAMNTWQGEIADTAWKQNRAKLVGSQADVAADEAVSSHDKLLANQAFRSQVSGIDQAMDPMKKLFAIADSAMNNGLFDEAEKALKGAGAVATAAAVQDVRQARAEEAKTKARTAKLARATELMQGVNSEEQLGMANTLYEAEFKEPSPFAGIPFSPAFKEVATGTLKNQLTTQQIATSKANEKKALAGIDVDKALKEAQAALAKARAEKIKNTETDLQKNGGKFATATSEEKKTTAAVLLKLFPNLEGADIAKEEVSQEAKAVLARREAPDFKSAVEKVVKNNPGRFTEKEPGLFDRMKGMAGVDSPKQYKYGEAGGLSDPMPIPAKGSTLTVGQRYKNPAGVVKTWTEDGWK